MMKSIHILFVAIVILSNALAVNARQWKDRTGSFAIEAEFVSFKDGKVYLEKKDGQVLAVPIEKLGFADYDYLRSRSELRTYLRQNPLPTEHTIYMQTAEASPDAITFTPDGKRLLILNRAGLAVVDFQQSKTLSTTAATTPGLQNIRKCKISPDGTKLVTGNLLGAIVVWQIDSSGKLQMLRQLSLHKRAITAIEFAKDGRHVATGCEGEKVCYWNTDTGQQVHAFEGDFRSEPCALYINPKQSQLVATDGTYAILYDLRLGKPIQKMAVGTFSRQKGDFSSDGKLLLVGRSSEFMLWKTVEGVGSPKVREQGSIQSLAFSPDDRFILVGTHDSVNLWDTGRGMVIQKFKSSLGSNTKNAVFSPDGQHIAASSGSYPSAVQVYRIPSSSK